MTQPYNEYIHNIAKELGNFVHDLVKKLPERRGGVENLIFSWALLFLLCTIAFFTERKKQMSLKITKSS